MSRARELIERQQRRIAAYREREEQQVRRLAAGDLVGFLACHIDELAETCVSVARRRLIEGLSRIRDRLTELESHKESKWTTDSPKSGS